MCFKFITWFGSCWQSCQRKVRAGDSQTHTEEVVYGSVLETRANNRNNKQKGLFLNDSTGAFAEVGIKQLMGLSVGFEMGGDGLSNTMERVIAGRGTLTAATGATAEETRNGTQAVNISRRHVLPSRTQKEKSRTTKAVLASSD